MRHMIVGICGDIGSGKDTVADHLVKEHGFQRLGLADVLKELIVHTLRLERRYLFGTQADKNEPIPKLGKVALLFKIFGEPWTTRVGCRWTGRFLAEFIGTDCFRSIYPNVWLDHVEVKVEKDRYQESLSLSTSARHVISDVRFMNEVEMVRRLGGQIWETVRPDSPGERTGHVSDGLDWEKFNPDYALLAKTGELKVLRDRASRLVQKMEELDPEES